MYLSQQRHLYLWFIRSDVKMDINTPADSTQQRGNGWLPNWLWVRSPEHNMHPVLLQSPSEAAAGCQKHLCFLFNRLFNISLYKAKAIHFAFTKNLRNTKDIAERDSSLSYLDFEDAVNHKKPYSLPQSSLWRSEGLWCPDLEEKRSEKFFWDIQEAFVLSAVYDGKHFFFSLSSLTARISTECWFRKATNL